MNKKKIKIYTDGSHLKKDPNAVTYGAVLVEGEGTGAWTHSGRVNVKAFFDMFGVNVSNPTAELYAAVKMLELVKNVPNLDITIIADYEGVKNWMTRQWKITKPYIQFLADKGFAYMDSMEKIGSTVSFEWVKGHNGNKYNEIADELCQKEPHDEIGRWANNQLRYGLLGEVAV